MRDESYTATPFPRGRQTIIDSLTVGSRRHIVHGLIEVDVTRARRAMRQHKARTGEGLSFTAFVIACFARALDANKRVQAYRDWRNRLLVFDDVDVVTMIEAEVGGVAIPHVIRSANRRPFRDIHSEIRAVQSAPHASPQRSGWLATVNRFVPGVVRRFVFRLAMRRPRWLKRASGTAIVTAVGMFGTGGGWGFGILPVHTIGLLLGGIAEKPGVVEGRIEVREFLDLTVSIDHDVVDGADAARFVKALRALIESGDGLDDA
jgi:pyruvate/2-oxoglutarate dehydrogenase complex dihydrolipoamide acyltransferase (E2) component